MFQLPGFQWLTQTPNATTFFGCVNDDKYGKILEEKAKLAGVNVKYQKTEKAETGTCAVIVTGTKRYIIMCLLLPVVFELFLLVLLICSEHNPFISFVNCTFSTGDMCQYLKSAE